MNEDKYGYHRSFCTYCERITPHEDVSCMICGKCDSETVDEYEEEKHGEGLDA